MLDFQDRSEHPAQGAVGVWLDLCSPVLLLLLAGSGQPARESLHLVDRHGPAQAETHADQHFARPAGGQQGARSADLPQHNDPRAAYVLTVWLSCRTAGGCLPPRLAHPRPAGQVRRRFFRDASFGGAGRGCG